MRSCLNNFIVKFWNYNMDEKEFFDKLAPTWDANEVLSTPDKIRFILDYIDLKPGQRVLDLGTGTGVLIPYIAERVGKTGTITAVDYSMGMLDKAKEKFSVVVPTPDFIRLDFETETISGIYDRIILYCVYPHLHTPIDTLKWLRSVNLVDGGIITIAFPTGPEFINNVHREKHSESDILPSAEKLAEFLCLNGLNAKAILADDHSYVVNIYK